MGKPKSIALDVDLCARVFALGVGDQRSVFRQRVFAFLVEFNSFFFQLGQRITHNGDSALRLKLAPVLPAPMATLSLTSVGSPDVLNIEAKFAVTRLSTSRP